MEYSKYFCLLNYFYCRQKETCAFLTLHILHLSFISSSNSSLPLSPLLLCGTFHCDPCNLFSLVKTSFTTIFTLQCLLSWNTFCVVTFIFNSTNIRLNFSLFNYFYSWSFYFNFSSLLIFYTFIFILNIFKYLMHTLIQSYISTLLNNQWVLWLVNLYIYL